MDASILGVILDSSLLIGASAIELGYAVATSNLRDFTRIPGLRVLSL